MHPRHAFNCQYVLSGVSKSKIISDNYFTYVGQLVKFYIQETVHAGIFLGIRSISGQEKSTKWHGSRLDAMGYILFLRYDFIDFVWSQKRLANNTIGDRPYIVIIVLPNNRESTEMIRLPMRLFNGASACLSCFRILFTKVLLINPPHRDFA